jgi:hypothetical protein
MFFLLKINFNQTYFNENTLKYIMLNLLSFFQTKTMATNSAMLLYKNYEYLPTFCMKETDNKQPD